MLRQKALVEVLGQVNTAEVTGALLFNREGLLLAYSGYGDSKDHANVSAALISSIWESFDKKGGREDLKEAMIICEDGVMAATRVANMLLALKETVKRHGTVAVSLGGDVKLPAVSTPCKPNVNEFIES
ncbi:Roadblock/LC7 domain protein [Ancylostoma ceylanicum]|uniref:Roadblock/LC7 domain protein n=1 Tax=Ancylostoma ceylanicum TaxID=53326 RepID=A0A0D6M327_9BILA|nr:Roadblock/LC7 domain protein [Ancylostoma ceylanicum]